jgi:hypothetical protein
MHIQQLGGHCGPGFDHSRKIENVRKYKQVLCKSQDRILLAFMSVYGGEKQTVIINTCIFQKQLA